LVPVDPDRANDASVGGESLVSPYGFPRSIRLLVFSKRSASFCALASLFGGSPILILAPIRKSRGGQLVKSFGALGLGRRPVGQVVN
jgi:hypothetical protein